MRAGFHTHAASQLRDQGIVLLRERVDLRLQPLIGGAQIGDGAVELVAFDVTAAAGQGDGTQGNGQSRIAEGWDNDGMSPSNDRAQRTRGNGRRAGGSRWRRMDVI
ncbi:hypothetical protein ACFOLC_01435 [Lysobacter cavernae]|uniref:Uncharacterized protein n=1 Tax=Lysobacter cavernae TaxID=1685901 RepID=A0ABV7RJA1_9GAMM